MATVEHQEDEKAHTGFLQKIKDKLHIGHKHSDSTEAAAQSESIPSKAHEEEAAVPAAATTTHEVKEEQKQTTPVEALPVSHVDAPTQEGATDHHGGVPTFLTKLDDEDVPAEVTKSDDVAPAAMEQGPHETTTGHAHPTTDLNSLVGHESEHHGGVPTFLVALPDQDIPDEVTKNTSSDVATESNHRELPAHHGEGLHATGSHPTTDLNSLVGHESEHHGGVPTFLVALPDQDIPHEVSKNTSSGNVGAGQEGGKDEFDSEEVFSEAQQGEHHAGVPTFLVALPDQDIPDEVTKDTFSDAKDENLTSEDVN
jgi:hypothetical protein